MPEAYTLNPKPEPPSNLLFAAQPKNDFQKSSPILNAWEPQQRGSLEDVQFKVVRCFRLAAPEL